MEVKNLKRRLNISEWINEKRKQLQDIRKFYISKGRKGNVVEEKSHQKLHEVVLYIVVSLIDFY